MSCERGTRIEKTFTYRFCLMGFLMVRERVLRGIGCLRVWAEIPQGILKICLNPLVIFHIFEFSTLKDSLDSSKIRHGTNFRYNLSCRLQDT